MTQWPRPRLALGQPGRDALPGEVSLESLDEAAELTLVVRLVRAGTATDRIQVPLEPLERIQPAVHRAPGVNLGFQLAGEPPLRPFPQPRCGQPQEVLRVPADRLMQPLRDPRIVKRVPDVQLPPLTAVVGVHQHAQVTAEQVLEVCQRPGRQRSASPHPGQPDSAHPLLALQLNQGHHLAVSPAGERGGDVPGQPAGHFRVDRHAKVDVAFQRPRELGRHRGWQAAEVDRGRLLPLPVGPLILQDCVQPVRRHGGAGVILFAGLRRQAVFQSLVDLRIEQPLERSRFFGHRIRLPID